MYNENISDLLQHGAEIIAQYGKLAFAEHFTKVIFKKLRTGEISESHAEVAMNRAEALFINC